MAGPGHNNPPPEAGPYAIYRTAKIVTTSNLRGSINHLMRINDTPNADPERAHLNRVLVGSSDPLADVEARLPEVGERNPDTGKMLRRKNSVITIEVLLTVSPEWWAIAPDEAKAEWEKSTVEWLRAEYGKDNVVHLQIHGDERTPHITGYVVPIDPDSGGLNCRRWLGGRHLLSNQQTAYAASVEHLGIQRGVPGSTATHEAVRRAYGQMNGPEVPVAVPAPSHLTVSPDAWAAEATKQMIEVIEPTKARANTADSARTSAKASAAQAKKDRNRADRAEAALADAKEIADRMRALDLPKVLDALGLKKDKYDKAKWKADGFSISVGDGAKTGKWFDHKANKGRGGAIDLVAHVMGTDYKGAVSWLADRFGEGAATADVTARLQQKAVNEVRKAVKERPPFTPPAPAPANWSTVRNYLVDDRALPSNYIDKLYDRGDLYADARRNAVFLCRDKDGTPVGAELKGTIKRDDGSRFSGMSLGSSKEGGGFKIGNIAKAKIVYLVESAIDAISLMKLRTMDKERDIAVISTAGTTPEPRTWFAKVASHARRICAFDNDEVGDKAAHKLRRHGFERFRPAGHDWNDDLKALINSSDQRSTENPFTPNDPLPSPSPTDP